MRSSKGITLDEFKNQLAIADIVGRFVKLTRHGRELTGLCPFHKEKTPSFSVVEDKGFYHCFGCGAHGSAIDFVMNLERLSFPEALTRLAELTGIEAPQTTRKAPEDPKLKSIETANGEALRWFQSQLNSSAGTAARNYLAQRKIAHAVCAQFQLGYAPNARTALKDHLTAQGYDSGLLVEAGLVSKLDDGSIIDRFRDRLMYPILDVRNRCLAFGGRALGPAKAKYLNTAETPVFKKGEQLYGLNFAKAAAHRANRVFVVEGYMDVIAMHRGELPIAVAPLGTAVTEAQLKKLWQCADEPVFCLDGDQAGERASMRVAERAMPMLSPGKSLQFVSLPSGLDPDSLLEAQGIDGLHAALEHTETMIDFIFRTKLRANSGETPERRARLKKDLVMLAGTISDPDIRAQYQAMFRQKIDELWHRPAPKHWQKAPNNRRDFNRLRSNAASSLLTRQHGELTHTERNAELDILRPLIANPGIFEAIEHEFVDIEFAEQDLRAVKTEILEFFSTIDSHPALDAAQLRDHLTRHGFGTLVKEMETPTFGGWKLPKEVRSVSEVERWRSQVSKWHTMRRQRAESEALLDDLLDDDPATATARLASLKQMLGDEESDP